MRYRITLPIMVLLAGVLGFTATPASAFWIFGSWQRHDNDREVVQVSNHRRDLRRERVRGTVVRVSGQVAYIRTSPFRTVMVRLGPESYWEEHGYRLVPGERVSAYCWYDPDEQSDLFFAGSISGPGFSFSLTNDIGEPLWVTDDYEYVGGWYPTYRVYDVWYRPTYHYEEIENAPPPRARVESGGPRGMQVEKAAPPGHQKNNRGRHEGRGGPHGD